MKKQQTKINKKKLIKVLSNNDFTLKEIKHNFSINSNRRGELLGSEEIDWLIDRVETLEVSVQGLINNLNNSMKAKDE